MTTNATASDHPIVAHIRRVLRQNRVDLVHCHSRRGADILGGLAAQSLGLPCVLSRRVDNPEPSRLVPLKYRLFDRVIAISEGIRELIKGSWPEASSGNSLAIETTH